MFLAFILKYVKVRSTDTTIYLEELIMTIVHLRKFLENVPAIKSYTHFLQTFGYSKES